MSKHNKSSSYKSHSVSQSTTSITKNGETTVFNSLYSSVTNSIPNSTPNSTPNSIPNSIPNSCPVPNNNNYSVFTKSKSKTSDDKGKMFSMIERNGIKTSIIVTNECNDVKKIRNNKIYFNNGNVLKAPSGKKTIVYSEQNIVYEDLTCLVLEN